MRAVIQVLIDSQEKKIKRAPEKKLNASSDGIKYAESSFPILFYVLFD